MLLFVSAQKATNPYLSRAAKQNTACTVPALFIVCDHLVAKGILKPVAFAVIR